MKKDLIIGELNDVYGALLTPRQHDILTSYFDYDLSLSEIAENEGITRQAVHDAIVKASEQLRVYEESVGVLALKKTVKDELTMAEGEMTSGEAEKAHERLVKLLSDL